MSEVRIDDTGAVRTITLDRPESRNGLTVDICRQLRDAVTGAPDAIHAIVLTGANGAFCSGLDLKDAMRRGLSSPDELARGLREDFHGLQKALVNSPKPTIAALDGAAAGFGCDVALACDLRIGSEKAIFGEIFVKRGLMPDGGGTWLLPRIVGLGNALQLLLTGDLVKADEALRLGLVSTIVPSSELSAHVASFAARIAAGPPMVHKLVKQSVYAGLSGDITTALEREATGQLQLLQSADFREGVAAFLQKRDPKFTGQ